MDDILIIIPYLFHEFKEWYKLCPFPRRFFFKGKQEDVIIL